MLLNVTTDLGICLSGPVSSEQVPLPGHLMAQKRYQGTSHCICILGLRHWQWELEERSPSSLERT